MLLTWSKILFFFCLGFILAIFLGSFLILPGFFSQGLFILGLLILVVNLKKKKRELFLMGLCCFGFSLGLARINNISFLAENQTGQPLFFHLKEKFSSVIVEGIPFPESSLVLALTMADQSEMPFLVKQKLSQSGLRHLTAVSGLHIVILTQALVYLGSFLRFGRLKSNYFGLVVIWLFLLLIGFRSSALRAVLMASSFLIADILGRNKSIFRVIIFSATLMLFFKPWLLRGDIGFQLSFLAVLGIAFFFSFFEKIFQRLFNNRFSFLTAILAMTFSAQALTLPLILYYFNSISLISPLTNILVLPVMPYLMGFSFVFILLASISSFLGLFLLLPVWLLSRSVLFLADFSSQLPLAYFSLTIHWAWLLPCYLALFSLAFYWQHKKKQALLP